ncbi:NtrZ family periplasmic regulatory protein [Brevundimonas sp. LjRoot202]|uniref:NtrZ family periplasmic regulatory protein n=1 Tax=Brevundimonas sp. LjRoot202 TaxID=3342281 RepID=UPI003ECC35AB
MRQITRKNGAVIAGLAAGLTLLAVADSASAQAAARSRAPAVTLSEAQAARAATPSQSRLRFTERGRWGLDLNLSQPVGRESNLGDVEAGAYYRVNPRLRVGATAGLAEPEADPARPPQTDRRTAPRFRLESIFRF